MLTNKFYLLLALCIAGCSGSNNDAPDQVVPRDPENLVDMGPKPDVSTTLGEPCQIRLTVGSDTTDAAPTLEVTDVSEGSSLPLLNRSTPSNLYFDAPLGHTVEFTVVPSAGAPVAPLTVSGTVDQRCATLSAPDYATPVGLTLEALDISATAADLPPVFADVAAGLMLVRGAAAWHAIETTENGAFNVALARTDDFFAGLSPETVFTSLAEGWVLAADAGEVALLNAAPGVLATHGQQQIPTPLRVAFVSGTTVVVHDADGFVWEAPLSADASWTQVADAPQASVTNGGGTLWLLSTTGELQRRDPESPTLTSLGTLAGAPQRIYVNSTGTRIVALHGASCALWTDRCDLAVYDASLGAIEDDNGEAIAAVDVRAVQAIGPDFVAAADSLGSAKVLHIEGDALIDGERLDGSLVAERSATLPHGLAIATTLRTTFARQSDANVAFDDGLWTVAPRTDDFIELVESPCREPLTCRRVIWRADLSARVTSPGATLTLGRDRDIAPESNSDAYQRIDFVKDGQRANTSQSITLEPLVVPSGAPCLPIVDTTIAFERFTPAAKALHCITWWRS